MIADFFIHSEIIRAAYAVTEAATETAAEAASPGVATMFGLNGKLFLAQLINFGIVLFVLWKWAFPPIVKALEARSKKIGQSLEDARNIAKEKQDFSVWKNAELFNTRKEAGEIIDKAKADAQTVRQELLSKTRAEQERVMAQTRSQLAEEKNRSVAEARQELATLVVAASEKILRGKLDEKADKELIKASLNSRWVS